MLNDTLRSAFGAELLRADPVSGGDINEAYRLTLTDGRTAFMKANGNASTDFFSAEADGLNALRGTGTIGVPEVINLGTDARYGAFLLLQWIEPARRAADFWETFGRSLAALHAAPMGPRFGWTRDNYIGVNAQINTSRGSWVAFYRDCRLAPQFRRAEGYLDAADRRRVAHLLNHLDEYLIEPPHPSLLHGDLWSGNFVTGGDGEAWLIDPAVSLGHREADIAMTELFGGFHSRFYAAYREAAPMQPGYEDRRDLYNLYHLLNHLNLFGSGYLGAVTRILRRYN